MMAYSISVTTRISVMADTADEARELYERVTLRQAQGDERWQEGPIVTPERRALPSPLPQAPQQAGVHSHILRKAVHSYLAALSVSWSPKTLELQRYILGAFTLTVGAEREIRSLDEGTMIDYLASQRQRGFSPGYINLIAKTLRAFMNWLVKRGNLGISPMGSIKLSAPPSKPVPPFSDADIARLLGAATTAQDRAILTLLIDTGMRASELTGLKLGQIDLEQGLIHVKGKGDKVRTLALNERPRKALEAYLGSRRQRDGLIWPEGYDRRNLGGRLATLGHRAGVERCFPHRFRHSFATRFYEQTGDALGLSALLGHANLSMTQRYVAARQADIALKEHRQHSALDGLL